MLCEHCGTDNLDEALNCAQCGADMGDPETRLEEARERRKRRYANMDPQPGAAARGKISLVFAALGAYLAVLTYGHRFSANIVALACACAVTGLILGFTAIKAMRLREGVVWARGIALAGTVVSGGVLAIPLGIMLVTSASLPASIAREPKAINNLRKLSVAMQAYMQDNGEQMPGWMLDTSGQTYHNVWDQQIAPYLRGDDVFHDGMGPGIRSPSQPRPRTRVVCYGLNGLLITRPKTVFDGNADWSGGPFNLSMGSLNDPAATIVLAEIATDKPMEGGYALKALQTAPALADDGWAWREGQATWIDIDPRAWVETRGPVKSYVRRNWDPDRGVGRALHSGGACYAFADGHVAFFKLRQTVTGGQTGVPAEKYWDTSNAGNMWNPR
jgi:prepilin-type processing-associated H-X9-DG protein